MRRPSLPKLRLRHKKPLTPQAAAARSKPAAEPKPAAKPKPGRKLPPLKRPPVKLIVPLAVAILVVVLLLGTCGGDDEQDVRDTLDRFAQASREKDYQALCDDLLSITLVQRLRTADRPCEVVLRIGLSDVRNPTLEVQGIEIDGDEATAQVDTGAAGQQPLKTKILLVQEDADWRISALPDEQQPAAQTP